MTTPDASIAGSAETPGHLDGPLERTLGWRDLTLIVIGVIIGSGIFIVPSTVLRQVGGDVGVALLVWFFAGVLSLLGALTYGEMGAMRPEAGGLYVYLRDAFGPFFGFLYGWALFFVIATGSVAALSAAFTGYLGEFVTLGPIAAKLVGIVMVLAVVAINVAGTRPSASVQNVTTLIKFAALLIIAVVLLVAGSGAAGAAGAGPAFSFMPGRLSLGMLPSIGLAMIAVLWAYEGWQYATFSVGETIDPQRAFPRAMMIGTGAIIFIYCLANIAYVAAIGPDAAQETESIAATAVGAVYGSAAGKLVAIAILISIFSAANAVTLTATRVFFAMARDGVFFRSLAVVHPTLGTPAMSILAAGAWMLVLALSGTFEQLLNYVVFSGWIFYGLGAAAVFVFRRNHPDEPRPFRVPGYPYTPAAFVLAASAIVLNSVFAQPLVSFMGIGVVMAGAPAYVMWRRRALREAPVVAVGSALEPEE